MKLLQNMNLYNAQERSEVISLHIFSVKKEKSVFFVLFFLLEKCLMGRQRISHRFQMTVHQQNSTI